MRGVHSAGAMNALYEAGLQFDIICGSSAGSGNAVYWVDGNYDHFEEGWINDLDGDKFIKPRNAIPFLWTVFRNALRVFGKGGAEPILDLDYLVNDFYVNKWPLDVERINKASTLSEASIRFYIAVTNCETGEAEYIKNEPGTDILGALRAGSAMPLAYDLPVMYEGKPYADGGIADSIPVQKAIDEGAEEVWVILTRPKGYRKSADRLTPLLYSEYPKLAAAIRRRHEMYNEQLALVERLEKDGKARVIRPSPDLPISRFTRDRESLIKAVEAGYADAKAVLTGL